jgi:hypothetical protein
MAVAAMHADFAKEYVDDPRSILTDPSGPAAWRIAHRRHRGPDPPPAAHRLDFLVWYVERIDRLLYEVTDLANFTKGNTSDGDIDPELAFEHLLTLARLVRRTLALTTLGSASARKGATFEIADIYGTLSKVFGKTGDEVEFFKLLFNPRHGPRIVGDRLAAVPSPVGDDLRGRMAGLYDELGRVVLDSVWLPSKRASGGVAVRSVKDPLREEVEPEDEFVANVMRAYRNAHHGYFTRADPRMRPSRYLYLVDGNVPDSIAAIPPLWLIAYLADPAFVGWDPLPLNRFA